MLRRAICVVFLLCSLGMVGCQSQLAKAGSFSTLERHALRLDDEFQEFHDDVKMIFFGLEPEYQPGAWAVYEE